MATLAFAQPAITITNPGNNGTIGGSTRVSFTITAGSNLSWRVVVDEERSPQGPTIRSGSTTSETFLYDTTGLTDGLHTITVVATDNNGTTKQAVSVTVNNNNFIRFSAPAENAVVKGVVTVSGRAGSPPSSYELRLDSETGQTLIATTPSPSGGTFTFQLDTATIAEGLHRLILIVNDGQGSISQVSRTIYIDRSAPIVNISSPGQNDFVRGNAVPITATIDDPNPDRWEVRVDGGTTGLPNGGNGTGSEVNITWNTTTLSQGTHTITVVGIDKAGNRSNPTDARVTVTVDNSNPTAEITAPTANTRINTDPVTITGSVADPNLSGWNLTIDGGSTGITPSEFTVTDNSTSVTVSATLDPTVLGEGSHTLTLTALDKAGNTGTRSVTLLKDNSAPSITLTAPDQNATTPIIIRGSYNIRATIDDVSDVNYRVLVNGIEIGTGTGKNVNVPFNSAQKNPDGSPRFPDGTATVTVEATDVAGNTTATRSKTVTLDNLAPTVEITTPVNNAFVKNVVTINGNIGDADATYTLQVDGVTVSTGTGSNVNTTFDFTNSTSGAHTITLTATDKANNSTTKTVTVRVDKDKPTLRVIYPFNNFSVRPGAALPIVLDITDQNFNDDTPEQNSVDASGMKVNIKDSSGNIVATVSVARPLDARSATVARWTGNLVIRVPGTFRANRTYTLEASVTDRSGNVSETVTSKFTVKFL